MTYEAHEAYQDRTWEDRPPEDIGWDQVEAFEELVCDLLDQFGEGCTNEVGRTVQFTIHKDDIDRLCRAFSIPDGQDVLLRCTRSEGDESSNEPHLCVTIERPVAIVEKDRDEDPADGEPEDSKLPHRIVLEDSYYWMVEAEEVYKHSELRIYNEGNVEIDAQPVPNELRCRSRLGRVGQAALRQFRERIAIDLEAFQEMASDNGWYQHDYLDVMALLRTVDGGSITYQSASNYEDDSTD